MAIIEANKTKFFLEGESPTLNLSSDVIFPHKILLIETQVSRLRKVLQIIQQSIYQKLSYRR